MQYILSVMFLPVMLLARLLLTSFVQYRNVGAVNWHQVKWIRDLKPITDARLMAVSALVDEVAHREEFNATLDHLLVVRQPDTPAHAQVREFIVDSMSKLKWAVQQHNFTSETPHGMKHFTNIIATLNPEACHRLVLACHYDSKVMPDFVGATDSAVPCSQMIHLANVLDDALQKQKMQDKGLTLQLIFFDGEEAFEHWSAEDSLYGSRRLAEDLQKKRFSRNLLKSSGCIRSDVVNDIDRIEVFVLLDLLGAADPTFYNYYADTTPVYKRLCDIEKRLGRLRGLSTPRGNRYFLPDYRFYQVSDDHEPFMKRGVPIVHLIPKPFPDAWHTVNDNADVLHHPTIHNLNKIFTAFVAEYLGLEV